MTLRLLVLERVRLSIQGLPRYPGTLSRSYSQCFLHRSLEKSPNLGSYSNSGVRLLSTTTTTGSPPPPPPPPPPVASDDVLVVSQSAPISIPTPHADAFETSLKEVWANDAARSLGGEEGETFASLGLGGYSPMGLIQSSMEFIYNTTGLPWWGTIVATTLCLRMLFYPLSMFMQKNSVRMHNVNPRVERLKERQQMYTMAGNLELANYERQKMNKIFKENGVRPFLGVLPAVFQAVLMVSFFMALRGMANAPVATMATGGMLWFPDLTAPDPALFLPMISSAGFLISLELGGDTGVVNPQMARMKYVMRFLSVVMIGITHKMPAGIFMYWLTSSSFSICNALLLKVPAWRAFLRVEEMVKHPETVTNTEKRSWNENRKIRTLIDRKKQELKKAKADYEKLRNDPNPKLYAKRHLPKQG